MADQNPKEFRLQVGSCVIGLMCDSEEYVASLDDYFARPPVESSADIQLELELVSHTDWPPIPNSLFTTKTVTGNGFDIADGLITGSFDPKTASGVLRVKNVLTTGLLPRVFEQILYQAYYSARKIRGEDALLIHSAGVIAGGNGCLFVGKSGQGKSTVAGLSAKHLVINDEMNLVDLAGVEPVLHGTPFNGFFKNKSPGEAPLRGIYLLSHGPEHQLHKVGVAEAVATVAPQIVPPVGLEEAVPADIRLQMVDLAARLCDKISAHRLEFRPDEGFWDVIDRDLTGK